LTRLSPNIKPFPDALTSYDFWKAFAILLVIVDHLGYYFFPDENMWRAVGRICVPVWFFLIGYAKTRDIPRSFWIGSAILIVASFVGGRDIFPLTILLLFAFIRMIIDPLMRFTLKRQAHTVMVCVALFLLIVPSYFLVEYGTQGIILAMFGYFIRHKSEGDNARILRWFLPFSVFSYVSFQQVLFLFDLPVFIIMSGVILLTMYLMMDFQSKEYGDLTQKMPRPIVAALQFCGRRTLEIYVAHLVVFKILSAYLGVDGRHFFELVWITF